MNISIGNVPMRTLPAVLSVAIALGSATSYGAQPQEPVGQDLAATIALHGLPCDQVVASKRNGDSDYVATCKDGNRYHIFVDAHGRVVVQKL